MCKLLIWTMMMWFLAKASAKGGQYFDVLEEECKMNQNCRLPFCLCDHKHLPVNATLHKMPQMVVLTIDDEHLDIKSYQVYKRLFERLQNPDGCRIRGTFFVSDAHERASYCLIRDLYDKGHEMAVSSFNYTCPHKKCSPLKDFQAWHYTTWSEQIFQMRNRLNKYAGIPKADIVGFRAPLLEPSSDLHFRIIAGGKFLYDTSLITNTDDLIWPFTLDYKLKSPLSNNGPINSYPGLWELPVPSYIDVDNKKERCLKIWEGHCRFERTVEGISKFFRKHFLRSYYGNKAPVVIHLNGDWLKDYEVVNQTEIIPNVGFLHPETSRVRLEKKKYTHLDGLIQFINITLAKNKDVYFVTARQAIEWTRLLNRLEHNDTLETLLGELFANQNCTLAHDEYNGQCDKLKQTHLDYDQNESFNLDDHLGEALDKKLKIQPSKPDSFMSFLQSEVLFVNRFVIYFLLFSMLTLIFIILYDKLF